MSAPADVGFIFQCVLCGSFSVFAIDALDPAEVALRASGICYSHGRGHKVLQKDIHAAQEEILQAVQKRLWPEASMEAAGTEQVASDVGGSVLAGQNFVLLPCAACVEIETGKLFASWLDDTDSLQNSSPLSPQLAVTFEEKQGPPVYVRSKKWTLAFGVGPKELDLRLPCQLPAGQFRVLLPQEARPLSPPCRKSATDEEPPEVWECRRRVMTALAKLFAQESAGDDDDSGNKLPGRKRPVERAPSVGAEFPWLLDLLGAAQSAWRESHGRAKGSQATRAAAPKGAHFVPVPILSAAEVLLPLLDEIMMERGLC